MATNSGPCEWCGRLGKIQPVSRRWEKGFFEKDQVDAELARHWQAKQATTSPGAS
jgi:hypothetical protein